MRHPARFPVRVGAPLPQTPEEWQEVVDAAEWALALHAARQFGLVAGGPIVRVEQCKKILDLARQLGIRPHQDAIERVMGARP